MSAAASADATPDGDGELLHQSTLSSCESLSQWRTETVRVLRTEKSRGLDEAQLLEEWDRRWQLQKNHQKNGRRLQDATFQELLDEMGRRFRTVDQAAGEGAGPVERPWPVEEAGPVERPRRVERAGPVEVAREPKADKGPEVRSLPMPPKCSIYFTSNRHGPRVRVRLPTESGAGDGSLKSASWVLNKSYAYDADATHHSLPPGKQGGRVVDNKWTDGRVVCTKWRAYATAVSYCWEWWMDVGSKDPAFAHLDCPDEPTPAMLEEPPCDEPEASESPTSLPAAGPSSSDAVTSDGQTLSLTSGTDSTPAASEPSPPQEPKKRRRRLEGVSSNGEPKQKASESPTSLPAAGPSSSDAVTSDGQTLSLSSGTDSTAAASEASPPQELKQRRRRLEGVSSDGEPKQKAARKRAPSAKSAADAPPRTPRGERRGSSEAVDAGSSRDAHASPGFEAWFNDKRRAKLQAAVGDDPRIIQREALRCWRNLEPDKRALYDARAAGAA
eukprot:TRINITY_DN10328_c0_g1_i1.p1 TRINITY_DN10328_c0_g1~~TRINITY_DN10328_c0_g1_i1.p1  ORF type:complete len:500 (-),score=92.71 TRINITY_DN10328_c0_g1_i1:390-1889(-)